MVSLESLWGFYAARGRLQDIQGSFCGEVGAASRGLVCEGYGGVDGMIVAGRMGRTDRARERAEDLERPALGGWRARVTMGYR